MPTLNWTGKEKVINHHLDVPYRVLDLQYTFAAGEDAPSESENKIIRGDNLEALKALLPHYEGRVKCIYIDPPYNTGNENWVYNDNVNDPKIKKWLGAVVGKEGEDLSRHDKWLCMMYPRLKLLQRLLSDDGFIFISIDVFEYANLKCIMDEIFGLSNFRNCIAVRRGIKNVQAQFQEVQALSLGHEYIYVYSRNSQTKMPKLSKSFDNTKAGKWDTFWRGTDRPTMRYPILGHTPERGQWRWEIGRASKAVENYQFFLEEHPNESIDDYFIENLMATNEKLDFVRVNEENDTIQYYVPPQAGKLLSDNWMDILLSGSFAGFDTEKNVFLIQRIIEWISDPDSIILDSFAGSGTTAHAVLNLNKQDGGHRRFILVEMNDYAETITAERVRRVMNGYGEGKNAVEGTGGDFSFYELGQPLMIGELLNPDVPTPKVKEYVYFMETKAVMPPDKPDEPYLLGVNGQAAYYFVFEPDRVTVLDDQTLSTIHTAAEEYVIYADRCALNAEELERLHITFKKIPRDISRL